MKTIDTLERAITRLEDLKVGAFPAPYEPAVGGGGDHWYLFSQDEAVAYISANDGIDEAQREHTARLIAALSRSVDPIIEMLKRNMVSMQAAVDAGMTAEHVAWVAEKAGDMALARAILGENE